MKNIKLLVMLFCAGLLFTQHVLGQDNSGSEPSLALPFYAGVVDYVKPRNTGKGLRAEIYILDDNGNRIRFLIDYGANIIGKDNKQISIDEIKQNNKVKIYFITNSIGVRVAKLIVLVKDKDKTASPEQ
ncbi:MAG: hypothetical protein HY761_09195 [Candidatus Omnitrophica bacterium]|nr:hypothetical protein [Candidatus Omnitrophota bacterium]